MLGMLLDNYITTWYTFANLILTRHTSSSMTDIVLASRADWRCLDEALGERFSWCRWWHLQYRRTHTDDSADESRHRVILTAQWLWLLGCFFVVKKLVQTVGFEPTRRDALSPICLLKRAQMPSPIRLRSHIKEDYSSSIFLLSISFLISSKNSIQEALSKSSP